MACREASGPPAVRVVPHVQVSECTLAQRRLLAQLLHRVLLQTAAAQLLQHVTLYKDTTGSDEA